MAKYVVNKNAQSDGYHEVHNEETCNHLPEPHNRVSVGNYNSCSSAVAACKNENTSFKIDGCYYCSNACHTR